MSVLDDAIKKHKAFASALDSAKASLQKNTATAQNVSGSFSKPVLGTDADRLREEYQALETEAQSGYDAYQKAAQSTKKLADSAEFLANGLNNLTSDEKYASDAGAQRMIRDASARYEDTMNKLRASMLDTARAYRDYKSVYENYTTAVDDYNSYIKQQQAEYDAWRQTVRGEDEVQTEIEQQLAHLSELRGERKTGTGAYPTAARVSTPEAIQNMAGAWGDAIEKRKETERQIKETEDYLAKLREELSYAKQLKYEEKTENPDFEQLSKPAGSKKDGLLGGDAKYDFINDIDGSRAIEKSSALAERKTGNADPVAVGSDYEYGEFTPYAYMTDDEIKIYNYVYATDGRDAADEYLSVIQESLNARQGADEHTNTSGFEKALYWIPAGLDQWTEGVLSNFTDKGRPTTPTAFTSGMISEEAHAASPVLGTLYDAGTTISNMAPSILLSMATSGVASGLGAGVNAAATAGKIVGSTAMGASAAGHAYNEKIKEGYSSSQARLYSALVAASEVGLQSVLGGISKLGGALPAKAAQKISNIDNAFARVSLKLGASMLSEGVEEGLQEILEPVFAATVFNEELEPAKVGDVAYAFLLGALSAGVLEGGSVVTEDAHTHSVGKEFSELGDEAVNAIVDTGLDSAEGTVSRRVAEQLKAKLEKGEKISDYQLGRLYGENVKAIADENDSAATQGEQTEAKSEKQALDGIMLPTAEETMRETAQPEPEVHHDIGYTTDNTPFVTVEEDILQGVPRSQWLNTVKENLKNKFPDGILIGNNDIKINRQSRKEMTFSGYTRWLAQNDESAYADKLRSTNNADEILLASRDYINEGLNHERKDKIRDFARGNVLLRVGSNDYSADVIVGSTAGGGMLLYDIINLKPATIIEKSRRTEPPNLTESSRSGTPASVNSIRQNAENVNDFVQENNAEIQNERPSTRRTLHADVIPSAESAGENAQPNVNSIRQNAENVNDFEQENVSAVKDGTGASQRSRVNEQMQRYMNGEIGLEELRGYINAVSDTALDTQSQAGYNEPTNNIEEGTGYGSGENGESVDRRVSEILRGEQTGSGARPDRENKTGVSRNGTAEGNDERGFRKNGGEAVYSRDSEGRRLTQEQVERLQGTAVVDSGGNPLAVYHFTPNTAFETFAKGDIGFHFGTSEQAEQRRRDLGTAQGRTFRTYLNIKNPIHVNADVMSWKPQQSALKLWSMGFLTDAELGEVQGLEGTDYDSPAATMLREILESKGYDGVVYPNGIEGTGDSFIAFRNDQIVQTDILSAPAQSGGTNGTAVVDTNGKKAYNIGERSEALQSIIRRLGGGENVPISEIMAVPEIAAAEQANEGTPTAFLPNRDDVLRRGYEQAMEKGSWDGEDYRGPILRQRRLDIVIGLPGSGKSSVYTERLSREHGERVIDTDDFREYIPEYNGTNASVVHEEASNIRDLVLETALENGDNILLSTIGANAEKLAGNIKSYVEKGYSVYLHLNELQNSKAIARALGRYVRGDGSLGRYVSPRLIADYGDAPTQTYKYLTGQGGTQNGGLEEALRRDGGKGIRLASGLFEPTSSGVRQYDNRSEIQIPRGMAESKAGSEASSTADLLAGYDWYSNDVGYGEKPRLIESSQGSENNAELDSSFDNSPLRDDGTVRLPTLDDIERRAELSKKSEPLGRLGLHNAVVLPTADRWMADRVGDDKKTPLSLAELVEKIRHDFGLNITTGHIRGQGVLGQYNDANRGIRTRIAQNLPTIAHELGHHFDNRYTLSGKLSEELVSELLDNWPEEYKLLYRKSEWTHEAIAEFMRKFLQNRETAAIDYPLFTDYFLKALSSKDLALIEQLADEVNAYYSMDALTATSAIRLSEEGAPDARTPFEKLRTRSSALYQAVMDSNHAIRLFDLATGANTYKLASNSAYADAMAGQILIGDLTDANGQYVAPGLQTVLHGLDMSNKEEYRLFGEYLAVKHGPERLAAGMQVFGDDRKNSTAFMKRRQAVLEAQYPQFKEISERLYTYIQQFYQTWGVETGLIGEETLKNWRERWKYYVPFNRAVDKKSRLTGAKRGFANQNSTVKKAIGSGYDIVHPVDNLIDNMVKMVNAGVRNNVMRAISDSALKLGADARLLERVPAPLKVTRVDLTGVKDDIISLFGEIGLDEKSAEKARSAVSGLDNLLLQYSMGKAHGDVITVMKNGKQEFWKINDPLLLDSITNLEPKQMNAVLETLAVANRFLTSNITGNNLIWAIFSNFPRDFLATMTYSERKNLIELLGGIGSAYLNKFKGDNASPLYKEYLAMGGGNISAYNADRNLAKKMRKKIRKKLSGKNFSANPIALLEFVSSTVESGPRFATYKRMREAGLDPQEAFYEAMDVTVNFRRGGRISREINKVVPFFNANMQGLDKFRRWICAEEAAGQSDRKKIVAQRTVSFVTVSAALAAISYALNNSDDEKKKDYEQLSTFIKNSYWNFPLGDGKYFSLPKPREIGVLSSFFEALMSYSVGGNSHAFDEFYAYAAENCLPAIANDIAQIGDNDWVETGTNILGSLGVIGVVGYLAADRDFLGRPIVSPSLEDLEPKDQYTERTSIMAYWLGQAFNSSPQQIDFAMQQILGGWWKYPRALFPVGEEERDWTLGVGNTYVKDNQYSTDLVNWLYDRADATLASHNSDKTDIDKSLAAKWDDNMRAFYASYNKLAKDETETEESRGARQLVLDMIREYRKGIDNGTATAAQKAVEAVCRSRGDTACLPAVMDVEVKDGDDKRHALSDVQYVEFQTDYLRLYWEAVEDSLPGATTNAEKAAILLKAKEVAKEKAVNRVLSRIGAKQTDYFEDYSGMSSADIINFKAQRYLMNKDGSVKQEEIIDILQSMLQDGLNDDDAYALYISEYEPKSETAETGYNKDGTRNVYGVRDAGVDAETWLSFREGLNNLEYEKGESGARQDAIIELLDSLDLDDETYDILYSTEYKSNSIFG